MKTRYKLSYEWQAEMIVEIDDEKFMPEVFDEWRTFWSNREKDSLESMLVMLYHALIVEDFRSYRALADFREGKIEGFPSMGGSEGIKIISFESFEFDAFSTEVEELT